MENGRFLCWAVRYSRRDAKNLALAEIEYIYERYTKHFNISIPHQS